MSYQDHLKTCSYCSKNNPQKVTVRIKSASSYNKQKKLSQLGAIIMGTSHAGLDTSIQTKDAGLRTSSLTKGASNVERQFKLKELGKLIRG